MNKKITAIVVGAMFFIMAAAQAQDWPTSNEILIRAETELKLDSAQIPKVKVILEENVAKRNQVSPHSTQGLSQAQSEPLDSELYLGLSKVLTRSQMNQWNSLISRMLEEIQKSQEGQ